MGIPANNKIRNAATSTSIIILPPSLPFQLHLLPASVRMLNTIYDISTENTAAVRPKIGTHNQLHPLLTGIEVIFQAANCCTSLMP